VKQSISPATIVVAAPDQVSCDLGGETVILHLQQSIYYGTTEVGQSIWNFIQQPRTVQPVGDMFRPRSCHSGRLNSGKMPPGILRWHTSSPLFCGSWKRPVSRLALQRTIAGSGTLRRFCVPAMRGPRPPYLSSALSGCLRPAHSAWL